MSKPVAKSRCLSILAALLAAVGCAGPQSAQPADDNATALASAGHAVPAMDPDGWTDSVYRHLTEAIAGSAGQGKIAVFDFDNTTQARDIGEAVLARVQQTAAINPGSLSPALFPSFTAPDGAPVSISNGVFDYYEAVLASGGGVDPFREYSSLPMPASVFQGHTVADFLTQTAAVYDGGSAAADVTSGRQSTILGAGRPFVYPQMADLYGNLRSNGYDVWVVSAGVAWAVRWMVQNALNPAIVAKYGKDAALPLDHVVAVTMLMKDRRTGNLVSDYQLTHQSPDSAYIALEPSRMAELEVLGIPDGLSSWRGGKSGAIDNVIGRGDLFLAAGDSLGDAGMLARATNRLIVNRMNKPDLADGFAREIAEAPDANWMLQPVISSAPVGFFETKCVMAKETAGDGELAATTDRSLATLEATGRLGSFTTC